MKHVMLISDNEIIDTIYSLNLTAYVGCDVSIARSTDEAIKKFDLESDIDLVLCFANIGEQKTAQFIWNYLQTRNRAIPFIIIGKDDKLPEKIVSIPSPYNIKQAIRATAKVLDVTAQNMFEMSVPDFYPIPADILKNFDVSSSDIYFKVEKAPGEFDYLKVWNKGSPIDDKIKQYINKNDINFFYIPANERLKFINAASNVIIAELQRQDISIEDRTQITEQGFDVIVSHIASNQMVTDEIVSMSNTCISSINSIATVAPELKNLLSLLKDNQTKYTYLHSIMAAYVASKIISNIEWGGEGQMNKVSYVLFYHDIFLAPLFEKYPDITCEEELFFSNKLNEQERMIVFSHAQKAGELLKRIPQTPMGVDALVLQHHGTTNGLGIAGQFKDDISPLAKVIIIAEDFVNEILKIKGPYLSGTFDKEAIIRELHDRYPMHTYKKIINTLNNINI